MLNPVRDRVVVNADKPEEMTSFGLLIPDSVKERPASGVVVSSCVPDLSPGDRVLFSEWGGSEIEHEGVMYVILSVRDVLAVVTDG